jgi:hypothetical protein
MPDPTPSPSHPAALDPEALLKQCTIRRTKATGPGGQHRNKTDSAVILTHTPTGITAHATERRSQHANHREALKRLRLKLAIEHRVDSDPSQPPSALWQSRVKDRRIVLSADHADFPTLLAEALDVLAALGYDHTKAAAALGVTPSQLVKLLQKEPAALAQINAKRVAAGLHPLK